jgi:hypothetical protein
MQLIETKTLGAAAASIEFTSIPQTYTDLCFLVSSRSTTSYAEQLGLQFNTITSGYSDRVLEGTGSGAASASNAGSGTRVYSGVNNWGDSTANTFANFSIYIPNYAGSTNKSVSIDQVTENNATLSWQSIIAALWSNTSAITSVNFLQVSGNIDAGTTISLYGILKGSDGIVTTS